MLIIEHTSGTLPEVLYPFYLHSVKLNIAANLKLLAMKKLVLLSFSMLFVSALLAQNAHEWKGKQQAGQNFYDIQNEMKQKFEGKSSNKHSANYSKEYKQYKRWEYYWKNHVNEDGTFPNPNLAVQEWEKEMQKANQNKGAAGDNWTYLGPTTLPQGPAPGYAGMGRVNCISFDPNQADPQRIFVGTPSGGVWESINGGSSWTPLTDNMPNLGVSDILTDWNSLSGTMYMATGDADGQHTPSIGVYKSTDWGQTWAATGLTFTNSAGSYIYSLTGPYQNAGDTVYAATTEGLYVTYNGGTSWTNLKTDLCYQVIASTSEDLVYAVFKTIIKTAVYQEFNYNGSFGEFSTPWSSGIFDRIKIAPFNVVRTNGFDDYFFAALFESGMVYFIYDKWDVVMGMFDPGFYGATNLLNYDSQGAYNMAIAVNPNDCTEVVVGGVHGWKTNNATATPTQTWTKYLDGYWNTGDPNFYIHSDHHFMSYVPGTNLLFTGNDGGIHKINTATDANTDLSDGLRITQYYGIGGLPNNANSIIGGAQDNDIVVYNGTTWSDQNNNTDGIDGMIDYTTPNNMYAASQQGLLNATSDAWSSVYDASPPCANAGFVWPIAMNPINSSSIYAGCIELYKSEDNGLNWMVLTSGESNVGTFEEIAVAPSDSNVIYASGIESNGDPFLIVTQNDGVSWTALNVPGFGGKEITGIVVDPADAALVGITFGKYTNGEKVYASGDYGATWSNESGTLPNIPIHCIVMRTGTTGETYIGTDMGVYFTNESMTDWVAYNTGLPNVLVYDLEINYSNEKVRAGTFGRGMWESNLNSNTTPNAISESAAEKVSKMKLHPSPVSDILSVEFSNLEGNDYSMIIYNIVGGVIEQKANVVNSKITVDVSNYDSGVYFISLINDSRYFIEKFEVVK